MKGDDDLLLGIVVGEFILLSLFLLLIFGHALWHLWWTKNAESKLQRGRDVVSAIVAGPVVRDEHLEWLTRLRVRLRIRLFIDSASGLDGVLRLRLRAAARSSGVISWGEARCRSIGWSRRLQGARLLTLLGGGQSIVPALLCDEHPEVRAQAAEWAVEHHPGDLVERLLTLLGDEEELPRFTVQECLLRVGAPAIGPLAAYLSDQRSGLELALAVAAGMPDPRFLPPAVELSRSDSARIRSLSATLLGALGGDQAVQRLTEVLTDDDPDVRAAAARGLGKLKHWPAAPRLVALLRDGEWSVRREAGLALRTLGPPGLVLLRHCLHDADAFAADMARQVLDLPDAAFSAT